MLKAAIDALGSFPRLIDVATTAAVVPIAVAGSMLFGGHVASYFAAALGVILAARLVLRVFGGAFGRVPGVVFGGPGDGYVPGARGDDDPLASDIAGSAPARPRQADRAPLDGSRACPPVSIPGASVSGIERIRARVDEVAYAPGSPNVLSMTKLVARDPRGAPWQPGACTADFWRQDEGADTTLGIRGALDATTLPGLRATFDALVGARRRTITLDLHELTAVDGAGAAAVATLDRRCRDFGGELVVRGLANQPLAVFRLLGIEARIAQR